MSNLRVVLFTIHTLALEGLSQLNDDTPDKALMAISDVVDKALVAKSFVVEDGERVKALTEALKQEVARRLYAEGKLQTLRITIRHHVLSTMERRIQEQFLEHAQLVIDWQYPETQLNPERPQRAV